MTEKQYKQITEIGGWLKYDYYTHHLTIQFPFLLKTSDERKSKWMLKQFMYYFERAITKCRTGENKNFYRRFIDFTAFAEQKWDNNNPIHFHVLIKGLDRQTGNQISKSRLLDALKYANSQFSERYNSGNVNYYIRTLEGKTDKVYYYVLKELPTNTNPKTDKILLGSLLLGNYKYKEKEFAYKQALNILQQIRLNQKSLSITDIINLCKNSHKPMQKFNIYISKIKNRYNFLHKQL